MVSEDSTCTALLRERCLLLLLLLAADSRDRRCAVCGITFKITCNMERKQKNDFVPIRTRNNPAASNTHPRQTAFFFKWKLPIRTCELDPHYVGHRDCATRRTPTHLPPRRDRGCQNTCLYTSIPLAYVCGSVLSRDHWRMALSKLGHFMLERSRRIGQAWVVLSYYTAQLMTPCSKYFSSGSTLNGAPGGDRWARVL